MKRFNEVRFFGGLLFVFIAAVVFGFIVMALWNNILVPVIHVGLIGYWQALGIFLLSKILFSGFPGSWWGRHKYSHTYGKEMREKWQTMNPEEREKFKQEWRSRCRNWKENIQQNKTQDNEVTGVE